MPAELRARLESRAKDNGRSANSEIIAMLTALLDAQSPTLSTVPAAVLLEELITRYGVHLQIVIAPDVAERAGLAPPRPRRAPSATAADDRDLAGSEVISTPAPARRMNIRKSPAKPKG